jgi:hypothetical protein
MIMCLVKVNGCMEVFLCLSYYGDIRLYLSNNFMLAKVMWILARIKSMVRNVDFGIC